MAAMSGQNETEKALLKIYKSNSDIKTFVCSYTPENYRISANRKYEANSVVGSGKNVMQDKGNNDDPVKIPLTFDTSAVTELAAVGSGPLIVYRAATDVSEDIKELLGTMKVSGKTHKPPEVEFIWGSISTKGVVTSVNANYTLFEKGGMPVRADVELEILESKADEAAEPLESPDRTKSRVLTEDTNIWRIAEAEYDDAGYWREIAKANQIMNPLDIAVGTVLKVPALD